MTNEIREIENYLLGKLNGIDIYVKLKDGDDKQEINLNDLPMNVKDKIGKLKKELTDNPMNKWLTNTTSFFIEREDYHRLINLNVSILKNRSINNRDYFYYFLQSYKVDELKQICRDYEIKGFSKFNKEKLTEFIKNSLSDEEIFEYLEENETSVISREFAIALSIINKNNQEKIEFIKLVNENTHEIEIHFSAFNWDLTSMVIINNETLGNCERDCDCVIGRDGGFCSHFWVGFIKSFKLGHFKISDWKLTTLPFNVEKLVKNVRFNIDKRWK